MVAAPQTYVEQPPVQALAGIASSVWIQQVAPDAAPYVQRDIPTGGVELVYPVGAAPQLTGPLEESRVRTLPPGTTIVGVRFLPGGAAAALGVPGSELTGVVVDPADVWGAWSDALVERVADAGSPDAALTALQSHIGDRVMAAAPRDPLVSEAVRRMRWHAGDVRQITESLFISERQMRRRFRDAVGLAPKTLHRLLRFQSFIALAQHAAAAGQAPTDEGLARLAAEAGYADQSHLNRECLRLTGEPPGAFLRAAASACSCGHDHAASYAPVLRSRPRAS